MTNIKFNYLYRDGGNYKIHGSEFFTNSGNLSVDEIERIVKEALIDGEFFDPKKWDIQLLKFDNWDSELDHFWHEFESVELTSEQSTSDNSIADFLETITSLAASARF